jgi:hypothetical protein
MTYLEINEKTTEGEKIIGFLKTQSYIRILDKPLATANEVKEGSKEIVRKFNELAKNWKSETAGYSIAYHKYTNKNYLAIMGMGLAGIPVVALILKDLEKGPEFWHYALKNITDENPVAKEDINNLVKIQKAWLAWGKKKNLI